MVDEIFQTDPISSLGLPSPVSIGRTATVGEALRAVQSHGVGYVLVVEDGRPVGIMSEREVLMRIVARDVKYDEGVDTYMSHSPETLTEKDRIAMAIQLMDQGGERNIPIVDEDGRAVAVLRVLDIIHFLAEAFPAQVLNLPPRPHQLIPEPEGA
ncbi:MAG TPA: CBS domain-containing protein [Dehalococcoidia bacterium]|jgi:CBS domain-containing protein|nr:CBS domain-containing protein [Dehalococcoidia bacterium]